MTADKVRTFIAIDVPAEVRNMISQAQERLLGIRGAKVSWLRSGGIHLTLKFLGDVERERLTDVTGSVQECAKLAHPIELATTVVGGFPSLNRPRVLWLGIDGGPSLLQLQEDIEQSLAAVGYPPEQKRFHPHLTVGRVKSMAQGCRLAEQFRSLEFPRVFWVVREVWVMSSVLKPQGAEYSVIAAVNLGGG